MTGLFVEPLVLGHTINKFGNRRIVGCVWVYMEKVELRYWLEHSDEKNMNKLVE